MQNLFPTPEAPLVERLRLQSLADVIGQQHLIGEGKLLHTTLKSGQPNPMLLWEPLGVDQTTLARIPAQGFDALLLPVSAVFAGVKDIREAVSKAEAALQQRRRTILFIDEVHCFNKVQQDAFLPYVVNGLFTVIGANTKILHSKPILLYSAAPRLTPSPP